MDHITNKSPQQESSEIYLKPRDPRREFYYSTHQMNESFKADQLKTQRDFSSITHPNKDVHFAPQQDNQHQISRPLQKAIQQDTWHRTSSPLPKAIQHMLQGHFIHKKASPQSDSVRKSEELYKMFAARKLCLVLDLHQTLLHSAKFDEVDFAYNHVLQRKEEGDCLKPQRHLFRFPHLGMWIKLRPGIWNFLDKACKLFELHLYTMGSESYAKEMQKTLDPTGALFGGRIIFKGGDKVPETKSLNGVLGTESTLVIIDDSVRVWPNNRKNLIAVSRYIYFPCVEDCFMRMQSLLEMGHDERAEDGTLASILAALERIHHNFFQKKSLVDADVRTILGSEKQKILAGCCIIFSGLFRQNGPAPQEYSLWQTAQEFGATCTVHLDDRITHVVAATSLVTDKVRWAWSNGKYVVNPDWVKTSAFLYRRAAEHEYVVKSHPSQYL